MEVLECKVTDMCVTGVFGGGGWNGRKIWFCSEILVLERKLMKCPNFIYSHPLGNEIYEILKS